jgi:glycosyltransferase involved in cell wall biosynthesis
LPKLRVAIVAASLQRPSGQAVQADRLLRGWRDDPDVEAWLVPIDPRLPSWTRGVMRVKQARRAVTAGAYMSALVRSLVRADVIHVFGAAHGAFLASPAPAILAARILAVPVVLHYHNGEAEDHLQRCPLAGAVIRVADSVVVPSRYLVNVFARFSLRATPIDNIVDLQRFRFSLHVPSRARILSVRHHHDLYNVGCTLRAFQLIQRRRPDATLTVAGDGPQHANLCALATELGLRNVSFLGIVDHCRMPRLFATHDLYVQTPDVDNAPNSVIEAFASGVPVVSTSAGGVPLLLTDHEHGLLAPINDHTTVAEHVLNLLHDPAKAAGLARAAHETCSAYTWPRARAQWLRVYDGLRAPGGSRDARELNLPDRVRDDQFLHGVSRTRFS